MNAQNNVEPVKDEENELPVATAWRETLRQIVSCILRNDLPGTKRYAAISADDMLRFHSNISAYGETLRELPEESWNTSISRWQGAFWQVLVDLWTVESGRSDLVLHVRVFEAASERDGFRFEVDSVHVP